MPRGAAAHGTFTGYGTAKGVCRAAFLGDGVETPVFTRFSTVVGSRGSTDAVRDTRGFATKFYTSEGTFDLVGNNFPVFFIHDAIKFPDIVHAAKPRPDREIPQAQSAHDTFWDFVSLHTEAQHHAIWQMSDRAIPRSFRMMEGLSVHTFRLVDESGETSLVKFHWKPTLGVHSLVWDEAQLVNGADPDFHRRDLADAIEYGAYPEWDDLAAPGEGAVDRGVHGEHGRPRSHERLGQPEQVRCDVPREHGSEHGLEDLDEVGAGARGAQGRDERGGTRAGAVAPLVTRDGDVGCGHGSPFGQRPPARRGRSHAAPGALTAWRRPGVLSKHPGGSPAA